jgi:membrane protein involved in colicin uptake
MISDEIKEKERKEALAAQKKAEQEARRKAKEEASRKAEPAVTVSQHISELFTSPQPLHVFRLSKS